MNTFLPTTHGHTLALYTAGNTTGLPIIYLHGGPGSSCDTKNFAAFDLEKCFVIMHDQRGCGRSTPSASLENNTTWDLVADIEKIRQHFKLEKVLLFGGSWGSTLALAYAETHPEHVLGLVLRSICLAKQEDDRWLFEFGANQLFPLAWQAFCTGARDPKNLLKSYYQQLTASDAKTVENAALAWNNWGGACLEFPPMDQLPEDQKNYFMTLAKIEAHYFSQHAFLHENQLLKNLDRIRHLKAFIVHGAKDFLCPIANAYELHQAWPGSELTILAHAGHLSTAPGMLEALQRGVRYFL